MKPIRLSDAASELLEKLTADPDRTITTTTVEDQAAAIELELHDLAAACFPTTNFGTAWRATDRGAAFNHGAICYVCGADGGDGEGDHHDHDCDFYVTRRQQLEAQREEEGREYDDRLRRMGGDGPQNIAP